MANVSVIGACGHIGLPLSIVLSNNGHLVHGIDIDNEKIKYILNGKLPFNEEYGEEKLKICLEKKLLSLSSDKSQVKDSNVIIIIIGTQISNDFSPNIEPIISLLKDISQYLKKGQLIILRSTVSPGTTKKIKNYIEKELKLEIGKDIYLVYAPERSLQGKAINEIINLPQIISSFEDESFRKAESFFSTFVKNKILRLDPVEAELGKLMTNMFRYIQFAIANEFYLLADSFGGNINKIIDIFSYDYPRLKVPPPGPNVAGPCLQKDGWFLLERVSFADLISTSFKINESIPFYLLKKIEELNPKKACILGMTFKANNDDIRNSLSKKLLSAMSNEIYEVEVVDPYIKEFSDISKIKDSDVIILMTPHKEFKDLKEIKEIISNPNCYVIDIWGFWEEMKHKSQNGIFQLKDI